MAEIIESYELILERDLTKNLCGKLRARGILVTMLAKMDDFQSASPDRDTNNKSVEELVYGGKSEVEFRIAYLQDGNVKYTMRLMMSGQIESIRAEAGMWINVYPNNKFTITTEPI